MAAKQIPRQRRRQRDTGGMMSLCQIVFTWIMQAVNWSRLRPGYRIRKDMIVGQTFAQGGGRCVPGAGAVLWPRVPRPSAERVLPVSASMLRENPRRSRAVLKHGRMQALQAFRTVCSCIQRNPCLKLQHRFSSIRIFKSVRYTRVKSTFISNHLHRHIHSGFLCAVLVKWSLPGGNHDQ